MIVKFKIEKEENQIKEQKDFIFAVFENNEKIKIDIDSESSSELDKINSKFIEKISDEISIIEDDTIKEFNKESVIYKVAQKIIEGYKKEIKDIQSEFKVNEKENLLKQN